MSRNVILHIALKSRNCYCNFVFQPLTAYSLSLEKESVPENKLSAPSDQKVITSSTIGQLHTSASTKAQLSSQIATSDSKIEEIDTILMEAPTVSTSQLIAKSSLSWRKQLKFMLNLLKIEKDIKHLIKKERFEYILQKGDQRDSIMPLVSIPH